MFEDLRIRFRSLLQRRTVQRELDDELQFHIENQIEKYIQSGLARDEAVRRARIEFGGFDQIKERCWEALGITFIDAIIQDIRYALRWFRRNPSFTLIAAISLALAIGANSTIFSLAKAVLYDRLGGVPHPEQLRLLRWNAGHNSIAEHYWGADLLPMPDGTKTPTVFSFPVYRELRAHNQAMQDLFAFKEDSMNATIRGNAQRVQVEMVSGNYYQQLAVQPQLGRPIEESDDTIPAGMVAVISDRLWKRVFDRSPSVLGQTIKLNDFVLTIVGVNPPGFGGAWNVQQSSDVMVPLAMQPLLHPLTAAAERGDSLDLLVDRRTWWLKVMARTKPEVQDSQAIAALTVQLNAALRETMTVKDSDSAARILLDAGGRGLHYASDARYTKPVYVLLALTGLFLLLACANIANLLLARSAQRQREISVRLALGASRRRILRQLLTESLLLAAIGGLGGLLISYLARNVIPKLMSHSWDSNVLAVSFDWRVFGFTAAITILTGILFGLAPAWLATRAEVSSNLKENAETATRRRLGLSGKVLVAVQIALSTLLVVGAGLFVRTVVALNAVNIGFRADHLLLFEVNAPGKRYPGAKSVRLHEAISQSLAAVPGVDAATTMSDPLMTGSVSNQPFLAEGEIRQQRVDLNEVGASYFQTMGIPIIAGRGFGAQDTATSPRVAVINHSLAQKIFPGVNPVGKRFKYGWVERNPWIQIVGLCGDTRNTALRDVPPPQFYLLYTQGIWAGRMTYAVRTHLDPAAVTPSLRRAVQSIDPDLPMMNLRTQEQQIAANIQMERTLASLTSGFGLLALALACIGIYGMMAYSVASRRNEIGIRVALGAQPPQVRRMIVGESTLMTAAGIIVGLFAAVLVARLVKSMIYGIQPYDPSTILAGVLILLAVALAASWIPALRASGIQPMDALRHE